MMMKTTMMMMMVMVSLVESRQMASLADVRNGALRAKRKLESEMRDPNFGVGLPAEVVRQIAFDQEAFWDYLSKNEDDSVATEDEERDARRIIAQMAELEQYLVKPDKIDQVIPLQRRVVDEIKTLMKKEPQSSKYIKEGLRREPFFPDQ